MSKRLTDKQAAFLDELAIRYSDVLMQYAMRFLNYQPHLRSLAQECVQEAYLRAVKCVDGLMAHENPVGWLKVVLKHLLLNRVGSAKHRREELCGDVSAHAAALDQSAEDALALWETHQQLEDVLQVAHAILTTEEQRTLENHFLSGLTTAETALLESVPESTIRGRISRIRRKLKKVFPELCVLVLLGSYIK